MLLEELLALPTGTCVFGNTEAITSLPGVVQKRADGTRFIRWEDGFVTAPLGKVRDFDEYIAARTRLAYAPRGIGLLGSYRGAETSNTPAPDKHAA